MTLADTRVADKAGLWAVFSAGSAKELAEEGPKYRLPDDPPQVTGHGLFTFALLKALGSTAADRDHNGAVTLTEFQQFVTQVVREESRGNQFPVMSGKLTDVALAWAVGTAEICDGVDNDLDGKIDQGFPDLNGNGAADCLDVEVCNGIDDNGNGQIDEGYDLDRDGFNSMALCGSQHANDCDDNDIAIHPGQKDWGNLRDDDCDGLIDEDDFDRNNNRIPDFMEGRQHRLSQARWTALGTGAALLAAGVTSYIGVYRTVNSIDNNRVSDGDRAAFIRWSVATYATTIPGVVLSSVGIGLSFWELDFRKTYFPKNTRSTAGTVRMQLGKLSFRMGARPPTPAQDPLSGW